MLRDYPDFRKQLKNDVVKIYDDDLKIFLVTQLRKIDYLKDVDQEILVELAYNCNAEIKEKGSVLYNMDDDVEMQITDEIIIVFDGSIELFVMMDAGTEFSLEILPTGSILNPHNMLARRKHSVNSRFAVNTTFYYLKYSRLKEVARKYPAFSNALLRQKGLAEAMASRDQNPVDYIHGINIFHDIKEQPLDS